jgi:NADH:ubiquinone oxidoreductase subunit 5 (subunit L)/multisubunit Na+/H+ antiporter MnhA subunit
LINDNQDIRRFGSFHLTLPITYIVFLFCSLSLMAAPFFSGMFSKDYILEILAVPHSFSHSFAYILTLLGASFTALYS